MQPDLTLNTARGDDDTQVTVLNRRERLVLSLGLHVVCLVVGAAEFVAGEGRGAKQARRRLPRQSGQSPSLRR